METRRVVMVAMIAGLLSVAPGVVRGATPGRVNLPPQTDPAEPEQLVPLDLRFLHDDPDFPVVLLGKTDEGSRKFVLAVVDARNGKETWSPGEDPVIFILVTDGKEIQKVMLDEGFAEAGLASGKFITGGPDGAGVLLARLDESYSKVRARARF